MPITPPDPLSQSFVNSLSSLRFETDHWTDGSTSYWPVPGSDTYWTLTTDSSAGLTIDQTSAASLVGASVQTDGSYYPAAYPTLLLYLEADTANRRAIARLDS